MAVPQGGSGQRIPAMEIRGDLKNGMTQGVPGDAAGATAPARLVLLASDTSCVITIS